MVVILNLLNGLNNLKRNKMKQTAVEWLLENLNSEPYSEEEFNHNSNCWDKALEIEKEQISIAYKEGWNCPHGEGFPETGEQYYKQTYESNT
jgi:hypothetical protein